MTRATRGTAIITGAGSGIGAAIARRLSADGFALVLHGRDQAKLEAVGHTCQTPVVTVSADLMAANAAERILTAALDPKLAGYPLTALINNAAIFHRVSFSATTDEMWLQEITVNFLAPVRLIHAALARLEDGSTILNISSTLGLRPIVNTAAYSAVKAALNNLTQSLALELAPRIRVAAICPGLIDTPIHPFHKDQEESESRRAAHRAQPMGRMGRPEEIAAMASFLVGPESAWTTGSLHVVDGGISLL